MIYEEEIEKIYYACKRPFDKKKVHEINDYMKKIYKAYLKTDRCDKAEVIYKELVGYKQKSNDYQRGVAESLKQRCEKIRPDVLCYNDNYDWLTILFKEKNKNIFSYIKVYLSFEGANISQIFMDTVCELLQRQNDSFAAKISNQGRYEDMIFWVCKKDYFFLTQKLQNLKKTKPLRFIPYDKNNYGISREFSISQNDAFSTILERHFSSIDNEDKISFDALLPCAIDLCDEKKYNFHPKSLINIAKTLTIISGKDEVVEDDILLSDNEYFWEYGLDDNLNYSLLKELL